MKKLLLLLPFLVSTSAYSVSFDCGIYTSNVHQMICNSEKLSELDDLLNQQYNQIIKLIDKTFSEHGNTKENFNRWARGLLTSRSECKTEACLVEWYENTTVEYDAFIQTIAEANEYLENLRGGVQMRLNCNVYTSSVQQIICSSNELLELHRQIDDKYYQSLELLMFVSQESEKDTQKLNDLMKDFLHNRDQCKDESCILNWYNDINGFYEILIQTLQNTKNEILGRRN